MAFSDLLKSELPSKKNNGFYSPLFEDESVPPLKSELENIDPDMDTDYGDTDGTDADEVTVGDVQGKGTTTEGNEELDDAVGDEDTSSADEEITEAGYLQSNNDVLDADLKELAKDAKFSSLEDEKAVAFIRNNGSKISKVTQILKKDAKDMRKENIKDLLLVLPMFIPVVGLCFTLVASIVRCVILYKRNVNYKEYINNLSSVKRTLQKIDKSKLKRDDQIKLERMLDDIADAEDDWKQKFVKEGAEDMVTDPEEMEDMLDKGDDEAEDPDLEREITDADIADIAGVDDLEEEELTPEEEMEADNLMQLAATTELIKGELNPEERAEFVESAEDVQAAINEGFLLDSDVDMIRESAEGDVFTEGKIYTKTRVQFNKQARLAQLHAVAVNACASSKNDPDFIKLKKVNRMRRILRARLAKKYDAPAKRLCRTYFQRLKNSKSPALQQIAKKNMGDSNK